MSVNIDWVSCHYLFFFARIFVNLCRVLFHFNKLERVIRLYQLLISIRIGMAKLSKNSLTELSSTSSVRQEIVVRILSIVIKDIQQASASKKSWSQAAFLVTKNGTFRVVIYMS